MTNDQQSFCLKNVEWFHSWFLSCLDMNMWYVIHRLIVFCQVLQHTSVEFPTPPLISARGLCDSCLALLPKSTNTSWLSAPPPFSSTILQRFFKRYISTSLWKPNRTFFFFFWKQILKWPTLVIWHREKWGRKFV